MAVVFTNARVILTTATASGSVDASANDMSAYCKRVRISQTFDLHDVTTFGMTAHARQSGLIDWSAEIDMLQDFGAVDPLLRTIYTKNQSGSPTWIGISPTTGTAGGCAITTGNPMYMGRCVLTAHNPMDGAVGDPLMTPVRFAGSGTLYVASSSGTY